MTGSDPPSMAARRLLGVVLVALLLASATTAGAAAVARGPPAAAGSAAPPTLAAGTTQETAVEPDSVLLRATVGADGDARWLVEYRVRLEDENDTAAFEAYAADVRGNTSRYRERFANRMRATVADAENATGRSMSVRKVTVRTRRESLPQEYGVVAYRFEWTGFAVVDGDHIEAGDAVSGLFLDRRTTFVLRGPPAYRVSSATPTPDDGGRAATWSGPTSFGSEEPRVTLAPEPTTTPTGTATSSVTATTATASTRASSGSDGGSTDDGSTDAGSGSGGSGSGGGSSGPY